ncbi:MAG: DUF2917 domain-containing protein [Ramlibacter sp.]
METLALRESQQSAARPAGAWKLLPRRALTLHPRERGVLRVAEGQLWATLDGPHAGSGRGLGDLVIDAGGSLPLRAGQRVVIESTRSDAAAWFVWDVTTEPRIVPVPCWQPVVQSWRDLRGAVALSARAAGRLVAALGAIALASLPRRSPGSHVPA